MYESVTSQMLPIPQNSKRNYTHTQLGLKHFKRIKSDNCMTRERSCGTIFHTMKYEICIDNGIFYGRCWYDLNHPNRVGHKMKPQNAK